MVTSDIRSLEVLLGQIRAIHDELAERHAGLAVLHMDASVAALESHIRRLQADAELPAVAESVAR